MVLTMEGSAKGENVLFGYKHPKSFEGSESARKSSLEMDFSDVFGGPPRRYSMQEIKMKYSFSDTMESEDDTVDHRPSFGLNEKPVFGGESVNRRRFVSDDFYGDIFKVDESYGSPRRIERDPFGSAPGSGALSPSRPSPPNADPYGTSLPAQFSLPAKLTTSMDSPVGTFDTSSPEKSKATDGTSNGISNPQISKASFSKILNRSINGKNEARGDRQTYRQSPLSREVAVTSEESPQVVTSNEKVEDSKFKEGSHHVESSNDGSQFHFSIYKWAGGGVPLMIPLRVGKSPKLEGKFNMARSASSNGRIEFDNLDNDRSECDNRDTEPASANSHSVSSNHESESLKVERREDTGNNQDGRESSHDANLDVLESKFLNGASKPADAGKATLNNKTVHQSSHQEEKTEKIRKEVDTNGSQAARPEKKPLSALLGDKVEAQGNNKEQNESFVKGARAPDSVPISNKEKKNDARRKTVNKVSVDKDDSPGSPLTTANTPGKTGVKGKVRDFVKIFNHETVGKTKTDLDSRSRSFRWKSTAKYAANSEGSSMNNTTEKAQFTRVDDKSNAFSKVDENPSKDRVNQPSNVKTSNNESRRNNDQKTSSFPESFHGTFNVTSETSEDLFQESFSVEELSEDQEKGLQTNEVPEDFQASDAKIQQWSNGRKGNIRSLLSTLQYVLWPESGWKPVPLVDIIEGNAVKRSYQRALLYLHPDKLQQKGASSQQKYIAEKVFDILQEAWDHFNSIGGL